MLIKNFYIKLILKSLLICFGLYGICYYLFGGGNVNWIVLAYYTILSNIFIVAVTIYSLVLDFINKCTGSELKLNYTLKSTATVAIFITFIVVVVLLTPRSFRMGGNIINGFGELCVHYLVPLIAVVNWILFDEKTSKWYSPLLWLIFPLCYYIMAIIIAECGIMFPNAEGSFTRYPYFFMDVDILGLKNTIFYVAGVFVAFVALAYLFYGIEKFVLYMKNRKYIRNYDLK